MSSENGATGGSDRPTPPSQPADELLADDRLTAMGLLIETHAGLSETVERELEGLGLAGSAFEIMIRLARSPQHRLRMTELAAQSTLTNSGLTRVVDRLERDGMVTRQPCDHDRRGYFATVTPAGLAKVLSVLPAHLATIDRIFTGVLDDRERDAFLGALRKLRAVARPTSDPTVAASIADG